MDEQEFRANISKWDEASKNKRVERWKQLIHATYNVTLPNPIWYFMIEADDLFIKGHFIGVILLCASIVELTLTDQIKAKNKLSQGKIEKLGFKRLVDKAVEFQILNEIEAKQIDKLRVFRNALIHVNVGELNEMARKQYKDLGLDISELDAGLFISPVWEGGIDVDALEHLTFTRYLTVRFYGIEDNQSQ